VLDQKELKTRLLPLPRLAGRLNRHSGASLDNRSVVVGQALASNLTDFLRPWAEDAVLRDLQPYQGSGGDVKIEERTQETLIVPA